MLGFVTEDIYKQSFHKADDIWGGKFEDLTEFNLDPNIYQKIRTIDLKYLNLGLTNLNQKNAELLINQIPSRMILNLNR